MSVDTSAFLRPIIGEYLSGVCFVMDYVQLQFSCSGLSVFNPLTVSAGGHRWGFGDAGWRDSLCERISRVVRRAACDESEIRIEFEDDSIFRVSLRNEDYSGPEAFTFESPGAPMVVGQCAKNKKGGPEGPPL